MQNLTLINKMFLFFSVLLFIYMLWPGPSKIIQLPALPDSVKSKLEGDTIQVPNVSGYFSDNFRDFVVPFYQKGFWSLTKLPVPPYRLNYPPEFAFTAIKDQTESTYLEELVYPLRNSLFVNGFEPFYSNGKPKFWGSTKFEVDGKSLYTKATIRFYPSSVWVRFFVWLGIIFSFIMINRLSKKIIS